MLEIEHIDHVAITVSDLARSVRWYQETLGLERRFEDEWGDVPSMVCAGNTCVAIFPASVEKPKSPPGPDTISMRHVAFRVDRKNFELARERFRETGILYEFADHGVAQSIYISDPDGHRIEITTYEL